MSILVTASFICFIPISCSLDAVSTTVIKFKVLDMFSFKIAYSFTKSLEVVFPSFVLETKFFIKPSINLAASADLFAKVLTS